MQSAAARQLEDSLATIQEVVGSTPTGRLHSEKIAQIIYVPTEANIPIIEARPKAQSK